MPSGSTIFLLNIGETKMAKEHYLTTLDLPALTRSFVGLDRLLDDNFARRIANQSTNYPPYNIIKHSDTGYSIELAVAGFMEDELDVEVVEQTLHVRGEAKRVDDVETNYIHRGISARSFERTFTLADHVEVRAASYRNGILRVDLEVVIPEEKLPKKIPIAFKD